MDDKTRYLAATHAMQSGVAATMAFDAKDTEPKHLRTGVNVALRDHTSLVELLIAKGLFTLEEYQKAIADGMETEVKSYEASLSKHYGANITLG